MPRPLSRSGLLAVALLAALPHVARAGGIAPVWSQDFGPALPLHAITHDASLRQNGVLSFRTREAASFTRVGTNGAVGQFAVAALPAVPAVLPGGAPGSQAHRMAANGRVIGTLEGFVSSDSTSYVPITLKVNRVDGPGGYAVPGSNDIVLFSRDGMSGVTAPSVRAVATPGATPAQVAASESALFFTALGGIIASWHDPSGFYELADLSASGAVLAYPTIVNGDAAVNVVSSSGQLIRSIPSAGEHVAHVAVAPNDAHVAIWRTTNGGELCKASLTSPDFTCVPCEPIRSVTWSPDSSLILVRSDSILRLHVASTLQAAWTLSPAGTPAGLRLVAADHAGQGGRILAVFARITGAPGGTPAGRLSVFTWAGAAEVAGLTLNSVGGAISERSADFDLSVADDGAYAFVRTAGLLGVYAVSP